VSLQTIEQPDRCRQSGFTLLEVALVLIIIGLLLGGIMKGMEMVNSVKVRRLAELSSSTQAAYSGFLDRYRRVPGDWKAAEASAAIGTPITGGGDGNGRIENPAGPFVWAESTALWEHLTKAEFISGNYLGGPWWVEPTVTNSLTPLNPFGQVVLVARTPDFEGTTVENLHVLLGRGIPVDIARELDVKLDDGLPDRGSIRATLDDTNVTRFVGTNRWGGREAGCLDATPEWNADSESKDCNVVSLF
jgi:prepilin-type N-terminal cleavage/methylation domain-containing protein